MRLLRALAKSAVTTIIFFALAETTLRGAYLARNAVVRYIPLPYVVGDDYGPIPPWLDNLLILRPDDHLIWTNTPNARRTYVDIFTPARRDEDRVALLRRFVPWLPAEFRASPTWAIALNADGYRSAPMTEARRPGVLRIACLGDSWTFGMNVDQDRTYPSRLQALLERASPSQGVEVMNFGVLGYSSFQGLQLLKQRVLDLHPQVLLIGFGMNDSEVAGYRDKDMVGSGTPGWRDRVKSAAGDSELYKLLRYVALVARFRPKTVGDYLHEEAAPKQDAATDPSDYNAMEPWTRVSPRDYEANVREMVRIARARQIRVVLVDNELWMGSPYRATLSRIARDEQLPLVDSAQIVRDATLAKEHELEGRLGLRATNAVVEQAAPAGARQAVIFRVYEGSYAVPRALSIAGTDPQLGDVVPNSVFLHDDGQDGDERAGDHVWSYRATFDVGARVHYVYTNSGRAGQWEGLDLPHIREVAVSRSADGGPLYLPVETFGKLYMQADNWHTDAAGYDLIARAVEHAIVSLNPF